MFAAFLFLLQVCACMCLHAHVHVCHAFKCLSIGTMFCSKCDLPDIIQIP